MSQDLTSSNGGLAYSDNISVAWRAVGHDLEDSHLALVNASNEEFLRAMSVIGESAGQKDSQDLSGPVAQEVARLDLKLNLVLDLVSTLIYHQLDVPDTTPVTVSPQAVAWQGDVPPPGATVYLQLYIKRGLPKPLCCYGEVVSSDADYAAGKANVRFIGLTGAAKSWLEKLIFRHHRQEVAYRRSTAT